MICEKHGKPASYYKLCMTCIDEVNREFLSAEVYERGLYQEFVAMVNKSER